MFDEQNQNPAVPKNLPAEPVDMFAGVEKGGEKENTSIPSIPDALSAGLLKKTPTQGRGSDRNSDVTSEKSVGEVTTPPAGGLPPANQGVSLQNYQISSPILGKIFLFLAVVLLLGGLGYGGWWLFYGSKNQPVKLPATPTSKTGQTQPPKNTGTTDTSANIPAQINNDQILFGQAVDSDKDDLDDVREKEIGTNPRNTDSDGDGLSDGDEVIVNKTEPLKADTDSDGLSDGDEVLIWRTNPLNSDTDGDVYIDGEEVRNGYNPLGAGKLFNLPTTTATTTI